MPFYCWHARPQNQKPARNSWTKWMKHGRNARNKAMQAWKSNIIIYIVYIHLYDCCYCHSICSHFPFPVKMGREWEKKNVYVLFSFVDVTRSWRCGHRLASGWRKKSFILYIKTKLFHFLCAGYRQVAWKKRRYRYEGVGNDGKCMCMLFFADGVLV